MSLIKKSSRRPLSRGGGDSVEGSIERACAVIQGDRTDRPPLFDLIRNSAAIRHFTGQELLWETAPSGSVVRMPLPSIPPRPAV